MTPDAPLSPDPASPRRRIRVRKKRRYHGVWRILRDLWLPLGLLAAVAVFFGIRFLTGIQSTPEVAGYISNPLTLTQEYWRFEGRSLRDVAAQQQFEQANDLVRKGDWRGAIMVLESISKTCAEPMIFHNMGVLYAQLNDHQAALNAFRETLARDPNYAPTRTSLNSLPGFNPHDTDPIATESEPNNDYLNANLISLDTLVAGDISDPQDVDFFRFIAPPSPRDLLRVEIGCQSPTLIPRVNIYDETGHPTGESAASPDAGARLALLISPKPNTTLYLEVAGDRASTGKYVLRITPTHAYDRFEPNDDFASAYAIAVGQVVEANIMSSKDLDFYSFITEESGKIEVRLQNESKTLIPAFTIFGPDRRAILRADEYVGQGQQLSLSINALEHQVYYLEVWGQTKSAGNYSLVVR